MGKGNQKAKSISVKRLVLESGHTASLFLLSILLWGLKLLKVLSQTYISIYLLTK